MEFVIKDMNRVKNREDRSCPMSIAHVVKDFCDDFGVALPFTIDTFVLKDEFEITHATHTDPMVIAGDAYLMIRMGWSNFHIVVIWDGAIIYPYLIYCDNDPLEDRDVKSYSDLKIPFSGEDFHRNLVYLDNV